VAASFELKSESKSSVFRNVNPAILYHTKLQLIIVAFNCSNLTLRKLILSQSLPYRFWTFTELSLTFSRIECSDNLSLLSWFAQSILQSVAEYVAVKDS